MQQLMQLSHFRVCSILVLHNMLYIPMYSYLFSCLRVSAVATKLAYDEFEQVTPQDMALEVQNFSRPCPFFHTIFTC